MQGSRTLTVGAGALGLIALGWAAAQWLPADARAQDHGDAGSAASYAPSLRCRVFPVEVRTGGALDTSDRTSEIGQWIGEQEGLGFQLYTVDFEVGQKSTGYPQGYVQICLFPA